MAVLCMVDLLSLSYPVRAVVNFGQPRVGNQHVRDAGGGGGREEERVAGRQCPVLWSDAAQWNS